MAGGDPIGCAARKKSKNKTSNYSLSSENGGDMAKNGGGPPVRTTRGGLRVYKIVILGDGGVGKSGKCIWLLRHTHTHKREFMMSLYLNRFVVSSSSSSQSSGGGGGGGSVPSVARVFANMAIIHK